MKLLFTPGADGIGTLVLSNPPRNTFDQPLFAERSLVERVLDLPGQKALILQGEGRHFSHGADPAKLRSNCAARHFSAKWTA